MYDTHGNRLKASWPFTAEAASLFARFTTPPTVGRQVLINNAINALVAAGVWALLDALYVTAAETAQAAQQNWKANTFNLTPTASPTFTADRGYAGNGTTSYLATGYTPSTAGGNLTQNSAHLSVWCRNNIQSSTQIPIGSRTAAAQHQMLILPRLGTDVAAYRINQDVAGASPASTSSIGHWVMRRNGAATLALFRNGASFSTDTSASTGLSTAAITLDAINTGGVVGSFATHQIAAASIGGSLSDAQALAFYNVMLTYMQAVGAA